MTKLIDIEGIGPQYAELLKEAGIHHQEGLLTFCKDRKGRETLAEKTGISHKLILKWTNQADMARVHGIGEEYSELLEKSGVDSVPELAQRNPESLHHMMSEMNNKHNLVRKLPSLSQVEAWISEAKTLPRAVFH